VTFQVRADQGVCAGCVDTALLRSHAGARRVAMRPVPLCACAGSALAGLPMQVEGEELPAHRIVLTARSPVFHALLNSGMREGAEGVVKLEDVRAPVFRALLHFVYTDALPQARPPARMRGPALPRRGACPGAERVALPRDAVA